MQNASEVVSAVRVSNRTKRFALGVALLALSAASLTLVLPLAAEAQQTKPAPKPRAAKPAAPVQQPAPTPEAVVSPRPANELQPPAPIAPPREEPIAFEAGTAEEAALGYPLGVGDVVRVSVYQQPDMATDIRVSELGTITVPLLGPVPVAGVTAKRVEDRIASLLKSRGLVRDPQVIVTVLQFKSRQVSVLGFVSRPGRYALEEGTYRLTDVLALAGGTLLDGADTVTLVRTIGGKTQKLEIDLPSLFKSGDFSANPVILGGDSIYVARAPLFYIYGEVNRPGMFRLDKDINLMQALSMGGGVTQRGTEKNVQIRRRNANGDYDMVKGALNERIQPNDVIFVRESLF